MAVTFPTSPTNGQQLVVDGKTYTYSSAQGVWNITGGTQTSEFVYTRQEFVATANQTTFNVTYSLDFPVEVFVNGLQFLASDFTATNGTTVVFDTGLAAGAEVIIQYATSASSIPSDISDLTDTTGLLGAGGATEYASLANLPSSGNTTGDFAITSDTKALYVWDGVEWKRVYSGPDVMPEWSDTTVIADSYTLMTDGTPTEIVAAATDPDGFPITYSYDVSPVDQSQATISYIGGKYIVTPSTNLGDQGTFIARFKATDGVNVISKRSAFTLILPYTSIAQAITDGESYDSIITFDINGTPTPVYVDANGWALYSSFTPTGKDATNYPAINGNQLLWSDLATYGFTESGTQYYYDGVSGNNMYGGGDQYIAFWDGSAATASVTMTTYNGPSSVTNIKSLQQMVVAADGHIKINGVAYTDTVVEQPFDPLGTTPIWEAYEGNNSVSSFGEIWIKF